MEKKKKRKPTRINLKEINSNINYYSRMYYHIINILLKILDLTKKHKK